MLASMGPDRDCPAHPEQGRPPLVLPPRGWRVTGAHGCEWVMDRGYWKGKPCSAPGVALAACGLHLCPVHRGLATDPERLAKQPKRKRAAKGGGS